MPSVRNDEPLRYYVVLLLFVAEAHAPCSDSRRPLTRIIPTLRLQVEPTLSFAPHAPPNNGQYCRKESGLLWPRRRRSRRPGSVTSYAVRMGGGKTPTVHPDSCDDFAHSKSGMLTWMQVCSCSCLYVMIEVAVSVNQNPQFNFGSTAALVITGLAGDVARYTAFVWNSI